MFLHVLHDRIQDRVGQITAEHDTWPCRADCDSCCRSLAQIPSLTQPESDLLRSAFFALTAPEQAEVLGRLVLLACDPGKPLKCPLLDRETARCRVYNARPVSCRTYGFYVERDGGLYCDIIRNRVDSGEFTGVIWGNGESIQTELDDLGERRSLFTVFGLHNGEHMIKGIEHTAIAAADAESLANWYVSVLGFTINYKSANAIFVKAPDGSMIEIIHSDADRGVQTMKTQGIRHLALTVCDFDAAWSDLKSKNVQFLGEPQESKGNKVVFFTDPEGNYLHLLQRAAPLP